MTRVRRTLPRPAPVVASLLAVAALAACGSGSTEGLGTPLGSSSSITSAPTTSATSTPPADPRVAAVVAANTRLTTSLYGLVELLKKIQLDNDLSAPRQGLGTATSKARDLIQRQRAAAYRISPRDCTAVRGLYSQIRSQAAQATGYRGDIADQVHALKADVARLDAAVRAVITQRAALAAALAGVMNPPATLTTNDVKLALDGAAQRRKDVLATISAVSSASSDAGASVSQLVGQAQKIADNACPA